MLLKKEADEIHKKLIGNASLLSLNVYLCEWIINR